VRPSFSLAKLAMTSKRKTARMPKSPATKRFIVSGYLTISVSKEIEAASAEEAKEKAQGLVTPSLCWQCESAGRDHDETWILNGFDDTPDDCVLEVVEKDWRHCEKILRAGTEKFLEVCADKLETLIREMTETN